MFQDPAATFDLANLVDALAAGLRTGTFDPRSLPSGSLSLDDGLRVQLAVLDRLRAAGEELGGWKVGLTSAKSHDKMGKGFRPFGFIRAGRVFPSGAPIPLADIGRGGIETELAFTIAKPLRGGSLSTEEVRDAIAGVRPAFELHQTRISAPIDHGMEIANDLGQWGIVIGDLVEWTGDVRDVRVEVVCDGETVATAGPNFPIDDPLLSLSRLCATLAPFDLGLEPGQHVITGAFFHSPPLESGGQWAATFSGVGAVTASVVES
jgi:2-keto-4-pentenoate hydratase